MSNAELGIAETDAVGAKARMEKSDGFSAQNQWNANLLGERTTGFLLLLCLAALAAIWLIDVSAMIRYGVTTLIAMLIVISIVSMRHRKTRLRAIRERQLREHASAEPREA